jgi:FkbM family methyltransferase
MGSTSGSSSVNQHREIGMFGHIKSRVFSLIAHNRDSLPVRSLHKVATFVDAAYRNEGSNFFLNGESRVLDRLANQNFKIAVDVGVNVGHWAIAALEAWPHCHVHGFEIAPQTAAKCRQNLAAHLEGRRGTVYELGMSDRSGSIQMYFYPDKNELTCASEGRHDFRNVPFTGQVVTLDDFCRDNNLDHVDFLKIDVEGDEYKVLKGANRMISSNNVGCIQFEYGAFSVETRFLMKDYYSILEKYYWIGKIYPNYVDFRDYIWTLEDYRFCNYVCVLRSKPELRQSLGRHRRE